MFALNLVNHLRPLHGCRIKLATCVGRRMFGLCNGLVFGKFVFGERALHRGASPSGIFRNEIDLPIALETQHGALAISEHDPATHRLADLGDLSLHLKFLPT